MATDVKVAGPPPPLLIVVSGPSGAGKDSLLSALREAGVAAHYAVTATTRPPRPTEKDGADYYFLTESAFRQTLEAGGFLEHAVVYGRYYGVPKAPIAEALAKGRDAIMRIDVQGAATIKALVPQAVMVFLLPGSLDELEQRLRERNTEDGDALRRRLETVREEMERLPEFDYAVLNTAGKLAEAVESVRAIIRAERCRVGRAPPLIP